MTGGAQEALKRVGAVERGREREEMDRQEDRERKAGKPVQERREEARLRVRGAHQRNTANAARRPSRRRSAPNAATARSTARERHGVHSRRMLRKPIGAWIATASTNTR